MRTKAGIIKEIARYLAILLFPGRFYEKRNGQQVDENVIVTMTTLPSRIKNIAPTIASLCDQTVRPSKILINIPRISRREKTGYKIPEFLMKNALVEINQIEEDLGPATKLLPALKKYEGRHDVCLVVADDDEIYSRYILENYLKFSELSQTAALACVGWDVPASFDHKNRKVKFGAIGDRPSGSEEVATPTPVDCLQGASTFMVRSSFFSSGIFSYQGAPKEAFFVDDIYISAHLAIKKIPVMVVPAPFRYARMKVPTHLIVSETLHKKENKSGHNNNTLYHHYATHWHSLQ